MAHYGHEVIELSSDDEDGTPPRQYEGAAAETFNDFDHPLAEDEQHAQQNIYPWQEEAGYGYEFEGVLGLEDVDIPNLTAPPPAEPASDYSEDGCLQKVIEVCPDIDHEHVRALYRIGVAKGKAADETWCLELIGDILDGGKYPLERDRKQELKRKRAIADEDPAKRFEEDRGDPSKSYKLAALDILKNEFHEVPLAYIRDKLKLQHTLYRTYFALYEDEDRYDSTESKRSRLYTRIRQKRMPVDRRTAAFDDLQRELAAVKDRVSKEKIKRFEAKQKEKAEKENEDASRANNSMADCGCCFTEYPTNRMTFCNGEEAHFFCYDCAANYVKAELGQGKCRPKCMDTGGCSAGFTRKELMTFLDEKTFETLERFQQQDDVRNASIEDLEECPFCEYKAICPPKEVDREFRCLNFECEKVSCRLCREETHVPMTCEQASKDKTVDARHEVEEAMTAALVRGCNKCKKKFIKESGCNKMTCPTCGNLQCYICSTNVSSYHHFEGAGSKCPLYDDTNARHETEVQKAEKAALEKVRKENPHLSENDLKIKVSEQVLQAERFRRTMGTNVNRRYQPAPPPLGYPIMPPQMANRYPGRVNDDHLMPAHMQHLFGVAAPAVQHGHHWDQMQAQPIFPPPVWNVDNPFMGVPAPAPNPNAQMIAYLAQRGIPNAAEAVARPHAVRGLPDRLDDAWDDYYQRYDPQRYYR